MFWFHSASVIGEIKDNLVPPFVESFVLLVIVPLLSERASFVYSASLGERVKFICNRSQPFLFSS